MKDVLGLLIPHRCAACARPGRGFCGGCAEQAASLRLPGGGFTVLGPHVAAVGAFAYESVVRDAVRGMKIAGRWDAGRHFAPLLRDVAGVAPPRHVTWVPSTRRRHRERGVDLPRLLAGPDAVPLLYRRHDRPDQTSLTPEQRRTLPDDTFAARMPLSTPVMLVDDVRTTGATAVAAANALLAAGARRVLIATLAVGGDDARQTTVPLRHLRAT